jgi:threonylcarbamoyladenosine tRNA methylthiotransferase MtaB
MYVNDGLIDAVASNPKICRHLHIPLQSGDDGILKAMNRNYTSKDFYALAEMICKKVPDCAITTDIIAGFPGETNAAFQNTLNLAEKAGFSRIHIFPFSRRPTTPAFSLPDQIAPQTIKERYKNLNALRAKLTKQFVKRFIGEGMEVLVENKGKGLTSNYIKVEFDDPLDSSGKLITLQLNSGNLDLRF